MTVTAQSAARSSPPAPGRPARIAQWWNRSAKLNPICCRVEERDLSILQKALLMAGALAASSAAVRAEPIDCDRLAHTKQPFQLTRKKTPDGALVKAQVYRSDNLMTTIYRLSAKGVTKEVSKGGIAKSVQTPEGNSFSFAYALAYQGFIFEATDHFQQIRRLGDRPPVTTDYKIEKMENDDLSVGPCVFPVSHFKLIDIPHKNVNEIWYSKDLQVALKTVNYAQDKRDESKIVTNEAVLVETAFVPAQ